MDFDGAVGNDGAGIGIWVRSPFSAPNKVPSNVWVCSYKLAFDCSNNEAKYEALMAGLEILRKLNAKRISLYGDSELVIKQVRGEYQAKHPWMQAYRHAVLDILKLFSEYTLTCVHRIQNSIADALAKATSSLKIPMNSSNKFEIHVKHRPIVLDKLFAMEEGKLLGHIISKDVIRIDPARVQVIQQIDLPRNKKEIQSFNDIIYVLKNLSPPPDMTRNKAKTLKLKAAKFCILNSALYWKDPGGVLLNCLVEKEAKKVMEDFHEGDCGGHLFWKSTSNKILRAGWILTATDYFTKWIEEIPTRQAIDAVIISFLENNILSLFGCPNKLITDNATTFKSKRMVEFFHKYHIILGHSTAYHPQGNGLVESSNKSLVNIIKKLLEINKKSWHKRLVNALWVDRVSQKKSIGTSPFELVYGFDTVFPTSLAAPVVKLL
eukprot:PITA_16216